MGWFLRGATCAFACFIVCQSWAQLRLATYNITNYNGGRNADLETIFYGQFSGRSFSPDVIVCQEFVSAGALSQFLSILNNAPGSPKDWAAASFIDGADTDSVFLYRTSKVAYLGTKVVSFGSSSTTQPPRNTYRYDCRPKGYGGAAATLAIYTSHMKAGSTQTDQNRRLVEAERIRSDAETLPTNWNFVVAGDFNIPNSDEPAYVELVGAQPNDLGRSFDPISTPGLWNNNSSFRYVHTQDPATQMDDRFDQILTSVSLLDKLGFDYIGKFGTSYSTSTWNDPNHSYRAWGNDGASYNQPLRTSGNTMVGPAIAQAIINVADGLGHIPVFLDLRVPPKITAPVGLDFGNLRQGQTAQRTLTITNSGDTGLWTTGGIADLVYTLTGSSKVTVPGGTHTEPPGGSSNLHTITLDTSQPGRLFGEVMISSNDPDQPILIVRVTGRVVGRKDF